MKPLVSVIIPCYNYATYVTKAIDSVLAQTYKPFEVILVDDGSTDSLREVVAPYLDRIRVIHQANRGLPGARNRGVQESKGDYLAFLDADDFWYPHKLERQMEVFESKPDVGVVYGRTLICKMETDEIIEEKVPSLRGHIFQELYRKPEICGSFSSAIIRQRVFDEVGLFNESLRSAEDYEMFIRISAKFTFDYPEGIEPLVCIQRHDDSMRHKLLLSLHSWLQVYEIMWNLPERPPLERAEVDATIAWRHHWYAIRLYKQRDFAGFRQVVRESLRHSTFLLRKRDIWIALIKSFLGAALVDQLRELRLRALPSAKEP